MVGGREGVLEGGVRGRERCERAGLGEERGVRGWGWRREGV